MRAALGLAQRGLGSTWPNPSVGCVIVADGVVVGRGRTADGGRPHAEPQALAMAGTKARGATAYVSLEPCCFHGHTPACTDALIEAGIACVVVGTRDPDRRVNGAGIARLRAAGIEVVEDVLRDAADKMAEGLIARVLHGRPHVTLKLASTLDGRIATRLGASQWITGSDARRAVHLLRGRSDAVMVGIGTALADDPDLTCRLPDFKATPIVRVVADSRLRIALTSKLVRDAGSAPTWLLARNDADAARRGALMALGVEVLGQPGNAAGLDLAAGLAALATRGITRLLVEGGAILAAGLLRADLVDRVVWFHAPSVMGGDGLAAAAGWGVAAIADMRRYRTVANDIIGDDVITVLERG